MDNHLINLSRRLYEYKKTQAKLNENHNQLKDRVSVNEEDVVNLMMGLAETYELILGVSQLSTYGLKDTVEVKKLSSAMSKVYVTLIKKGLKTIDDVPKPLRAEVESLLEVWENEK